MELLTFDFRKVKLLSNSSKALLSVFVGRLVDFIPDNTILHSLIELAADPSKDKLSERLEEKLSHELEENVPRHLVTP